MVWVFWRIYLRSNELSGRLRIISKSHWILSQGINISPWCSAYLSRWFSKLPQVGYVFISWRAYWIHVPPMFPPTCHGTRQWWMQRYHHNQSGDYPKMAQTSTLVPSGLVHSHNLGGGFKYFLFSPRKLGKWSNLTNMFQRDWSHKLAMRLRSGKSRVSFGDVLINTFKINTGVPTATENSHHEWNTPCHESPNRKGVFSNHQFSGNMWVFPKMVVPNNHGFSY